MGVTKALWKCVNYPALSGTLGPHVSGPSAWRKRHWCQRCSPSWERVSLWAVSWRYKPSVHQKKTPNNKPTHSLLLKEENLNILNTCNTGCLSRQTLAWTFKNSSSYTGLMYLSWNYFYDNYTVHFSSIWSLTASYLKLCVYIAKPLLVRAKCPHFYSEILWQPSNEDILLVLTS